MRRTSRVFITASIALCVAFLLTLFANSALAVSINYGDFAGATVIYKQVTEDSATDPTPLFGPPTVNGDQLDFNTPNFNANSNNGGAADVTDGQLNFSIWSSLPNVVEVFMMTEAGDYTLFGTGTSATAVSVSTPTTISIIEVDGAAIAPAVTVSTNMIFTPAQTGAPPDYDLANEPGVGVQWSGKLMFDVKQALIDAGVNFISGATKVDVVLDNILVAASESGTVASISKKDLDGFTVTANMPIPEPSTIVLLGLALAGLLLQRRRR